MKSSKPNARISFRLMLGLGLASYFTAGLIYAQVAGVRAYNNSGARHVDSNGTTGGGGGTGPGGGGPPDTPPPTTFQAAFTVQSSGYEVKANCVVCHNLSIKVGNQTLTSGQAGNFKLGVNYPVRIIDNPDTSRPAGSAPPDHDTAKFTVWPEAVDGQTITKTADDKAFVVSKNGVLQYIIDNQESLFAQDKSWDKNLLKKKGALVAVEMKITDRDEPTKLWADAKEYSPSKPIFAGETNGDMVSWKLSTGHPWAASAISWRAIHPDGSIIQGPSGVGVDEWKIRDGGNDIQSNWLTWKPGIYKIELTIGSQSLTASFEQMVGWRTEEYVVVGQIKPIDDIQLTSDQAWALKSNIVTDLANSTGSYWAGGLTYPPLEVSTLVWFAAQAFVTDSFSKLRVADFPDVGDSERLWMLQNVLNNNPDLLDLPNVVSTGTLFQLKQEQSYRMYSRNRYKYTVKPNGKIDQAIVAPISSNVGGPTKITLPVSGTIGFDWLNVTIPSQLHIPSEMALETTTIYHNIDKSGGKLASFVGGRINVEGRYPNYALFRRDAPFIFAETIFKLDEDRRSTTTSVRLSVNKEWSSDGAESGVRFFNEIRIYRRDGATVGAPFKLVAKYPFTKNSGRLNDFILSLPLLTWPSPEPMPTVKSAP